MGFRKPIDYTSVSHQIYMAGVEICSPLNDGYTGFYLKQDLYKIKWLIDDILNKSPKFSGEEEFIEEHEKNIVWKELNR